MSAAALANMTPEELAMVPLMPNPSGALPDFNTTDTTGPMAIAITTVFLAIATLTVTLRLISRISVLKHTGLDDAASVIALFFTAASIGFFFYLIHIRVLGPHSWDVHLVTFMRKEVGGSLTAIIITGNLANFFTKCAILLFVQRLFPRNVSPKTAIAIWLGLATNIIAYLIMTIWVCAKCIPRPGSHGFVPQTCMGTFSNSIGIAGAAVNAFLDLYTFAVSVPSLWMLRMPTRRKISVVGILAIGLCACVLSLVTLVKRSRNKPTDDPTRKQVVTLLLGMLEPLIAITTACLPAMPALWTWLDTEGRASLRRLMSRVGSTSSLRSKNSTKKGSLNETGDDHSLKSLNSHGATQSDLERGHSAIQVKSNYTVTSSVREKTSL